ncbi:glycosyltransferase [Vibrio sp. 2026]|uniref:glycosyltransferase n=1 Tax=unclassified Vibrio TaxID=2614977 RepID=UPI002964022E|nr:MULTISPECIES: glycosyltransferase [unclassified Vibrio]MDG2625876.1 glycosyltransferase [Vibrio parahaemolyticus]MDW1515544.1 glycosyltransferase [Vibrio sp. Vb5035]MDW1545581.1 glycosyltransferase [Vibrio sp. Vb5034]MDW1777400.1 glycosyltransferase [Vibrio sp. Vb2175]MDW1840288.1 glycosyltransferase [Vibrio sp. Vb0839]
MYRVCVLLAAYNGEKYIEEQIKSILSQQDVDVDLYIRLDPSTDRTAEIINDFSLNFDNVKLLNPVNASGSAGQNFFRLLIEVNFSGYDFIAFADQDDIWFPDKIKRALDKIITNRVDAYSSNVLAWWDSGKETLVNKSSPQRDYDYLFESAGPGCTFVFTSCLANEIKNFLESLGEGVKDLWLHDWFCYAFARSRGFSWFIDSKPMMKYRQHELNAVGANSGINAFIVRLKAVISGDAFYKALGQAETLGLSDTKPIGLLRKQGISSVLKLLFIAHKCRRKPKDQVLFIFAILAHSVKGGFK